MQRSAFSMMTTAIMLLLSVAISVAQGMCDGFTDRALEAVDQSCETVGRNQACYGFNRVEASFQTDVDERFFTQPADLTEIVSLETLRTAPLNVETEEWGVAVMVLQANMPDTLPGQNVTFILMGDAEIENAVAPEDAHQPIEGINVRVTFPQGAAVRSGAGDNFNTLGGVVTGTVFTVDGISADGNWLRTIWEDRPAWIRRTTVEQLPEIDGLPIFDDTLRTSMQAFYLTTGIGSPACAEVPDSSLFIQGPDDVEIDLTVNGANISLGSSGVLRVIEDESGQPQLEIIVLDGEFTVKADDFNPQDIVIRAGQRSTLCMEGGNDLGLDGEADDLTVSCAASPPEQIDLEQFIGDWCALESLPSSLLFYDVTTCTARTHTVASGENLFRIAQFYCVTQEDLIALNNIGDGRQLFVGQVLNLPPDACDGNGSTRPPVPPPVDDTPVETVDDGAVVAGCAIERISPAGNVNSGNHTFTWTAVAGDNISYVLQFINFEGIDVEGFQTTDTAYTLNLGRQTSTGGQFQWRVDVLQNGAFLCTTGTSPVLIRTGELNPPPPPPSEPGFTLTLTCVVGTTGMDFTATASWSNLAANDSVTIEITDNSAGFVTGGPFTVTNDTKSVTMPYGFPPATATVTTAGGFTTSAACS